LIILPNDITAESGVIATLIEYPQMFLAYDMLQPRHFYNQEYSAMYWAITELYKEGVTTIDKYNLVIKISSTKATQKMIDKVGGDKFLDVQLENSYAIARESEEEYALIARKIVECAFRRDTYSNLTKFENKILNTDNDLNELNGEILTVMGDSAEKFLSNQEALLYSEKLDDIKAEIDRKRKESENGIFGIQPAWDVLGEHITYEKGEVYAVKARMKSGKSIWLATEAIDKARKGYSVLFTSTEMSDEKTTLRLLAMLSGLPIEDIKAGKFNEHDNGLQRYNDAWYTLKNIKMHHEYHYNWDNQSLLMKCKIIKNKFGSLDFHIHDYLKSTSVTDAAKKSAELGEKANFLKNNIAGNLNLVGLTAVQSNRANEVAGSDEIARYVSCVMDFAKKEKEEILDHGYECGNRKLWIEVSRDGGEIPEDEALDFYIDDTKKTNLRLLQANMQHVKQEPNFMKD